jgi:hypothetical protein
MFCFWYCSRGMVCFVSGAVLMVRYVFFFKLFSWYGMFCFWGCSHGMVCFVFNFIASSISSTILYCLYQVYQVYFFSTESLPQSKESTIGV